MSSEAMLQVGARGDVVDYTTRRPRLILYSGYDYRILDVVNNVRLEIVVPVDSSISTWTLTHRLSAFDGLELATGTLDTIESIPTIAHKTFLPHWTSSLGLSLE